MQVLTTLPQKTKNQGHFLMNFCLFILFFTSLRGSSTTVPELSQKKERSYSIDSLQYSKDGDDDLTTLTPIEDVKIFPIIREGDSSSLSSLIQHYRDFCLSLSFTCFDKQSGQTPLTLAVLLDHSNIVKIILEHSPSSKNMKNFNGQNALQIAQITKNSNIIQLLSSTSSLSSPSPSPLPLSFYVPETEEISTSELLLHEIESFTISSLEKNALISIINDDLPKFIEITSQLDEINFQYLEGFYCIHYVASNRAIKIMEYFIMNYSTLINQITLRGATPLMLAVIDENHLMAKLLIESGADKYAKDFENESAFSLSFKGGDKEMQEIIIGTVSGTGLSASSILKQAGSSAFSGSPAISPSSPSASALYASHSLSLSPLFGSAEKAMSFSIAGREFDFHPIIDYTSGGSLLPFIDPETVTLDIAPESFFPKKRDIGNVLGKFEDELDEDIEADRKSLRLNDDLFCGELFCSELFCDELCIDPMQNICNDESSPSSLLPLSLLPSSLLSSSVADDDSLFMHLQDENISQPVGDHDLLMVSLLLEKKQIPIIGNDIYLKEKEDLVKAMRENSPNLMDLVSMINPFSLLPIFDWNIIHCAAWYGRGEVIRYLVEEMGVSINSKTSPSSNTTPLILASNSSIKPSLIPLLLNLGANVEHCNAYKYTALHFCASHGEKDNVLLLLSRGANPFGETSFGETPLDLARKKGHREIADILEKLIVE